MSLELADRSIQYPRGIIENVLIKVDKFFLPIDFVILDILKDSRDPIILGRPFLETARTRIDVFNKDNVKGLIYLISDSSWVSPIHVVLKKGGMTVVLNDNNELIPSRTVTRWRVCIDYHKLNDATRNDYFPLPFIDQMLEHLCGKYYCFLDGFLGFFQIPIVLEDQEKKTFTYPYGTFIYRRMPFGLCNTPATFQRCVTTIFHDMVEDFMKLFMDDFSNVPFKLMCDASDFAVGAVLGQRIDGKFKPIYYASKTLNNAQEHYTSTKKNFLQLFSLLISFAHIISYQTVVYTDHLTLKYLFSKPDAKPRLIRPNGGHHSALIIGRKVYEAGLFGLASLKMLKITRLCIKMVEAQALPTNDAHVVIEFLRRLFARFGVPKALIGERAAGKHHFMELNELMELRDGAYKNTRIYKERTKRWHDSRLRRDKNFKVGDKTVYPYGTIEIIDRNENSFKVNGQRLKKYHDEHIDVEDKEVVEFKQDTTPNSFSLFGLSGIFAFTFTSIVSAKVLLAEASLLAPLPLLDDRCGHLLWVVIVRWKGCSGPFLGFRCFVFWYCPSDSSFGDCASVMFFISYQTQDQLGSSGA
nr:putative reverse transcriptase domain-containing protein [Tanacetum cinerariifolium]